MTPKEKILAISLILLVTFIISIFYILYIYNNYNMEEKISVDKCEKFCSLIGKEYGKSIPSSKYKDNICLCKHKDFININNTTYIITRLLDYGVVINVTK